MSDHTEDAPGLKGELARLRAEIDAAQHRLHLTLDAAGAICSWDWDIVGKTLIADARFAAITGQDPVALAKGTPTSNFFHGIHRDDLRRIRLAVAGILAGAEVFSKDYRLLKEDGGFRWVHANGRAVFDADDQPIRFVGTLIDITRQKRAQEQLRIAQDAGGIGSFEHVAGFGTVTASPQFCRLFGLHPITVVPVRTLNLLIHPDDSPIIDLSVPDGQQDERDSEFRITRADDGAERWLARRGEHVDDPDAKGRRYIGVIYDVTEAKQTQERLRVVNKALAERVRKSTLERDRMWQNSRDPLVVLGVDGVIRDVNPAWAAVLGNAANLVIGSPFAQSICTDDRAKIASILAASGAGGDLEICHLHADGTSRWISWVTSREGEIIYAYGRDVTAEKAQAAILLETEAQLRQSQKMEAVGQLTGGIAHDFNNMLTGVIGALGVVRQRVSVGRLDDLDRFIDAGVSSAQRAAALTHRLLAFSRRQSLDKQNVDVGGLVTSMEDMLRRTLGEQIELAVAIDPATLPAFTDANQLESAVLNLVINARDAMPDGGKLTVETANITFTLADAALRHEGLRPGSYVVLAVSDTGIGMSKETIEKAFDPFFTTKPIGQGTGLGLSMIYGFAQQSGGHVRIYSELGLGTTVKLFLPVGTQVSAEQAQGHDGEALHPTGDGETVLVVEDDDSVRMLVVDVLNELGYRVLEAVDGNSAIPIVESNQRIDLMVSDVGLPGLNGRQLAEIAIKAKPTLKILFITGYTATAASRADFLAPGMDMITKPFAIDVLAKKIQEILADDR